MKNTRKSYRWIPVFLWMSLIFILSHQDASRSSQLSGGLMTAVIDALSGLFKGFYFNPKMLHTLIRKGAHFSAYLILGLLSIRATKPKNPKEWLWALIICSLYAASDEYHQTFIPGRSGELRDVLIDMSGSLTGILLYGYISGIRKRLYTKKSSMKAA